jgi:hypothetical protein
MRPDSEEVRQDFPHSLNSGADLALDTLFNMLRNEPEVFPNSYSSPNIICMLKGTRWTEHVVLMRKMRVLHHVFCRKTSRERTSVTPSCKAS